MLDHSRPSRRLAAFLLASLFTAPVIAQNYAEGPAIWREVTGIEDQDSSVGWDAQFTRPHVPSFRTTSDGRLGINVKGVPFFSLMKPEKLDSTVLNPDQSPLLQQPPGSYTMSWDPGNSQAGYLGGSYAAAREHYNGSSTRTVVHSCIWNDDPPTSNALDQDVYVVKVFVTTHNGPTGYNPGGTDLHSIQFFVTTVTVIVGSPKTENAHIVSVSAPSTAVEGPVYNASPSVTRQFDGVAFEPMIAGDGNLVVFRIGSNNLPVGGPNGDLTTAGADIVYSYYEGGNSADPTQWVDVYPISHAHHDSRINTKFGFALNPLLDPQGVEIPDWEDMGGTYPWIDRDAKNLFFTTIGASLHRPSTGWMLGRYPTAWLPNDSNAQWGAEALGVTRGVAFAGLWSRGKTVLLDNLNNDMDYAIGNTGLGGQSNSVGPQQRSVKLFTDGGANNDGYIQLGYGRANYGPGLPDGENENTTIIDSIENRLNYKQHVFPTTTRDVTWFVQNGKHTDQLPFDDYLDPDALVISSMAGLIRLDDFSGNARNYFEYDDGWDVGGDQWGTPASQFPIRMQNAATAHHRWNLPDYGQLTDNGLGRVEPAATGGVHGKGLWLDDEIGLTFAIPEQGTAPAGLAAVDRTAYVSLFVDCRFDTAGDDGIDRLLLSFPDGSRVFLRGREQVIFDNGTEAVHYATLPADFTFTEGVAQHDYKFLPRHGWAHLGLLIEEAGSRVTLLLNGLPYSRWSHPVDTLFRCYDGDLVVGDPGSPYAGQSFRGWVDDLKVVLRETDPETACNHANGTLVGVQAGADTGGWAYKFANSYPDWTHEELSAEMAVRGEDGFALYACFHDYQEDDAIYAGNMPADTTRLASAMHFPEGPLFHDAPRPDTSINRFCISCHNPGEQEGLTLDALKIKSTIDAINDDRRQPTQPPPIISGFVPAETVNAGSTPAPTSDEPLGNTLQLIDEWLLETRGNAVSAVKSVHLLRPNSGEPLLELSASGVNEVDPAVLGTSVFAVEIALDSAQGQVTFSQTYPGGGNPPIASLVQIKTGPYLPFKRKFNVYAGRRYGPGIYTMKVTPQGGVSKTYTLEVVGTDPRPIADYRANFQTDSPSDGWYYAWNKLGTVGNPIELRTLNWNAVEGKYTETGLDWHQFPSELNWGALYSLGGWPGNGLPGVTDERYVMAGYRMEAAGYVKISGLDVTPQNSNSTGIDVKVLLQSGSSFSVQENVGVATGTPWNPIANYESPNSFLVAKGDIVWVALGPSGSSSSDHFHLDYQLKYSELTW